MKGRWLYRPLGLMCMIFFGVSLLGMTLGGSPTTPAALLVAAIFVYIGWRLWKRGPDNPAAIPSGRGAGAPRHCPHCGATGVPYTDGCCPYCDNPMEDG